MNQTVRSIVRCTRIGTVTTVLISENLVNTRESRRQQMNHCKSFLKILVDVLFSFRQ